MNNNVTVTAMLKFVFADDCELSPAEFMEDIIDRIRRGEYIPSELVDLQVMQIDKGEMYAKGR